MRIAIISTPFIALPPNGYGGTELIVQTLIDELCARGHHVITYATGDSVAHGELRARFDSPIWPPDPRRELDHASHAIADLCARAPVDVIHAHVPSVVPLARFIDTPVVCTLHHERELALGEMYREARCSTMRLCAISERQRQLVAADGVEGIRMVHHGLPPAAYAVLRPRGHAAFVGRFAREKGVHVAIDAACAAGVPIRLAGKPHWKDGDYFERQVAPRLGRPGVCWIGEAGHSAKVELLGGAVATLFPIDWEEPFGLVMIESMLCGAPVLALPRGSAPELVEDGLTGWIVRDEDDMAGRLRALAEGELRFDRAACRARAAERFGARVMVDRYLEIYAEAAGFEAVQVPPAAVE